MADNQVHGSGWQTIKYMDPEQTIIKLSPDATPSIKIKFRITGHSGRKMSMNTAHQNFNKYPCFLIVMFDAVPSVVGIKLEEFFFFFFTRL